MYLIKYAFVLMCIIVCTRGRRIIRNAEDTLDLSPTFADRSGKECLTRNNQSGICVNYSYCNQYNYTIEVGGDIGDFELRSRECKPLEWCCAKPTNITTTTTTTTTTSATPIIKTTDNECKAVDSDECPWCVSLHRGDATKTSAPFCMGSMIGTKVILTASTCIKGAQKLTLWAQVPTSEDPKRKYIVQDTQLHQQYNSGSHAYDIGILVLKEDVDWGKKKWTAACHELNKPLEGECVGFGLDTDDAITSTLLTVKQGGCRASGGASDEACGTKFYSEPSCIISVGSPVLCSSRGKGSVVAGVARFPCQGDSAMLGSLSFSQSWLSEELKKNNVLPKNYQINAK